MASGDIKRKVVLGVDIQEFRKGISKVDGSIRQMSGAFRNLGGVIGATFAVHHIQQFTKEAIQLGSQLQKAQQGFKRFGDAAMLDQLRHSTQGLVTDLELMQRAVKAANLGVEMADLPKLLEFAKRRADETGESIDYMVDSIVTGIGRKSIKILDNLGLSAERIRKSLGGVSLEMASVAEVSAAVGKLADEELSKMGKPIKTAADDMERLAIAWSNFQAEFGKAVSPAATGILEGGMAALGYMYDPSAKKRQMEFDNERRRLGARLREWQKKKGYTSGATAKILPKWFRDAKADIDRRQYGTDEVVAPAPAPAPAPAAEPTHFAAVKEMELFAKATKDLAFAGQDASASMAMLGQTVSYELTPAMEQQIEQARQLMAQYQLATTVGADLGAILQEAWSAATLGEKTFFEAFEDGIKAYIQQMAVALGITTALAAVLSAIMPGMAFGQVFNAVGAQQGLGGFLQVGTILRGEDQRLQTARTAANYGRAGGN